MFPSPPTSPARAAIARLAAEPGGAKVVLNKAPRTPLETAGVLAFLAVLLWYLYRTIADFKSASREMDVHWSHSWSAPATLPPPQIRLTGCQGRRTWS